MTRHTNTIMYPNSIRTIGLRKYLNESKHLHNGKGYTDFVKELTKPDKYKLDKTSIGKLFFVSRHTITKWMEVFEAEKLDKSRKQNHNSDHAS